MWLLQGLLYLNDDTVIGAGIVPLSSTCEWVGVDVLECLFAVGWWVMVILADVVLGCGEGDIYVWKVECYYSHVTNSPCRSA